MKQPKSALRKALVALSLIATPLAVFLGPAIDLYLKNQEDFDYDPSVLLPFVLLALAGTGVGIVLFALRERLRSARVLLWAYYLAAPFFIVYLMLHQQVVRLPVSEGLVVLLLLGFCALALFLGVRRGPDQAVGPAAMFGAVLLVAQLVSFAGAVGVHEGTDEGAGTKRQAADQEVGKANGRPPFAAARPNIYHLILDGYQSDRFPLTITPAAGGELDGFVYYPRTTTLYNHTRMAVASIFSGRTYDFRTSQQRFIETSFASRRSFLYWLKEAGYETDAYVSMYYYPKLTLFDRAYDHRMTSKAKLGSQSRRSFVNTWLYSNLPGPLAGRLVDRKWLEEMKHRNVLPKSSVIVSYIGFKNFAVAETRRSDHGRYTYIHIKVPHTPNVMRADCTWSDDEAETTAIEHTKCATKVLFDLVELLKRLDRYEDSLIVVHGDHGLAQHLEGEKILPARSIEEGLLSHSNPLLLIKPPKARWAGLRTSQADAMLTDLAPTILHAAGLKVPADFGGTPLVDPVPSALRRDKRPFYFYEKEVADNDFVNEMTLYSITGAGLSEEKKIAVPKR